MTNDYDIDWQRPQLMGQTTGPELDKEGEHEPQVTGPDAAAASKCRLVCQPKGSAGRLTGMTQTLRLAKTLALALLIVTVLTSALYAATVVMPGDADAQELTCSEGTLGGNVCVVVGAPPTRGPARCPAGDSIVEEGGQCLSITTPIVIAACEPPYADTDGTETCGYETVVEADPAAPEPDASCPATGGHSVTRMLTELADGNFQLRCRYTPVWGPQCPSGAELVGEQCRAPVDPIAGELTCEEGFELDGDRCVRFLDPTAEPGRVTVRYAFECVGDGLARITDFERIAERGAEIAVITLNGSATIGRDLPGGTAVTIAVTTANSSDEVVVSGPGTTPACSTSEVTEPSPTAAPDPTATPMPTSEPTSTPRPTSEPTPTAGPTVVATDTASAIDDATSASLTATPGRCGSNGLRRIVVSTAINPPVAGAAVGYFADGQPLGGPRQVGNDVVYSIAGDGQDHVIEVQVVAPAGIAGDSTTVRSAVCEPSDEERPVTPLGPCPPINSSELPTTAGTSHNATKSNTDDFVITGTSHNATKSNTDDFVISGLATDANGEPIDCYVPPCPVVTSDTDTPTVTGTSHNGTRSNTDDFVITGTGHNSTKSNADEVIVFGTAPGPNGDSIDCYVPPCPAVTSGADTPTVTGTSHNGTRSNTDDFVITGTSHNGTRSNTDDFVISAWATGPDSEPTSCYIPPCPTVTSGADLPTITGSTVNKSKSNTDLTFGTTPGPDGEPVGCYVQACDGDGATPVPTVDGRAFRTSDSSTRLNDDVEISATADGKPCFTLTTAVASTSTVTEPGGGHGLPLIGFVLLLLLTAGGLLVRNHLRDRETDTTPRAAIQAVEWLDETAAAETREPLLPTAQIATVDFPDLNQ